MSRPAVKAGLIGGLAAAVIALLGLVPLLSCLSLPLQWIAYAGAGVLAAMWLSPPRQAGKAAGEGALAGLIAGLISGLVGMALAPVSLAMSGGAGAIMQQMPPEALEAFQDSGLDPEMLFGPRMALLTGAVCCGVGTLLAAALGALGGAISAAVRPE